MSQDSGLTREQIFNYLHHKKHSKQAPYGLIQRETELLDEIQHQR
jgi:hypothetical protein